MGTKSQGPDAGRYTRVRHVRLSRGPGGQKGCRIPGAILNRGTASLPDSSQQSLRYAQLLFENGSKSMQVSEKIYPLVLNDVEALLTWVSGTALIPYLERLPEELKAAFVEDYRAMLKSHFPKTPVFYPFKRILIWAEF